MTLLFEELNPANLVLARALLFFGLDIRYLHLHAKLHPRFESLKQAGIVGLSYDQLTEAQYKLFEKTAQYADHVNKKWFLPSRAYLAMRESLSHQPAHQRKLAVAVEREICNRTKTFIALTLFAEDLREKKPHLKVWLWASNDFFTEQISRLDAGKYKNLCPKFITAAVKIAALLGSRLKKKSPRAVPADSAPSGAAPTSPSEVVFFPHMGVFYGNLFVKDHYYSENPHSPFHKSRILHLSLGDSPQAIESSLQYYRDNNIPHADFSALRPRNPKRHLLACMKLVLAHPTAFILALASPGPSAVLLVLNLFKTISSAVYYLEALPGVKTALIGYDMLFPPVLSMALALRGITTVAVQERFMGPWFETYVPVSDHYFVMGNVVSERLRQLGERAAVGEVHVLGPVRLDLIHRMMQTPFTHKYSEIKKRHFLLLALDCHSAKSEMENRLALANYWSLVRKFYEDMIRLAEDFKDHVHIVIKGKNFDFLTNPQFADIVSRMQSVTNLSVETNLQEYTPEKMSVIADGAVAIYTSMADEMMAAGKPVVIYDYFGVPGRFFDYRGLPIIAHDYASLKDAVERMSRHGTLLSREQQQMLHQEFYNDSFDGKIRSRLSQALEQIHTEL